MDTVTGTSNNDTFSGTNGTSDTLDTADVLDGGAGVDTLNVVLDTGGTTLPAATYTSIEKLVVRDAVGATVDLDSIASVTEVTLSGGTANTELDNVDTRITNITVTGVKGDLKIDTGDIKTLNLTLGAIAGDATTGDDVDLDITEGTTAITTLNVTTTGNARFEVVKADEVKTMTIAATGGTFRVDDNDEIGALETLTVSGTHNVTFADLSAASALKTVTSTNTGVLDLDYGTALSTTVESVTVTGAGAVKLTLGSTSTDVTGGSGDDTISIASLVMDDDGLVDAGAGTDTLTISDSTATLFTTAAKANLKGFEILNVDGSSSDTVKFTALSGLTGLTIAANTSLAVTNLTQSIAEAGVKISAAQTTSLTIGVTDATDAGSNNSLKLNLDAGTGTAFAIDSLGAEGTETLTFNTVEGVDAASGDVYTITAFESGTDATKIVVTGNESITFTSTANAAALENLDASALTGVLTVTAVATTKNLAITGGSGKDDINGSSLATAGDVLSGGAGADRLTGNGGADKYTGGSGADTFEVDVVNGSNAATVNVITDFAAGTGGDQIELTLTDVEALKGDTATVINLVNWNKVDVAAGNLSVKVVTGDTTLTSGSLFVLSGASFADTDAVEAAIETGDYELTFGTAIADNDGFLVLYTDGTDSYIATVQMTNSTAATTFAAGDLAADNIVKLTGITSLASSGQFVDANFEII